MSDINICVQLYGTFRQYICRDSINLTMRGCKTGQQIKEVLFDAIQKENHLFNDRDLLQVSALACGNEIISDDTLISKDCDMAILPPVCGG